MSKNERKLQMISNCPVIRIFDDDMNTVTTIGAWSDCEHPMKDIAIEFIEKVKSYYLANPND